MGKDTFDYNSDKNFEQPTPADGIPKKFQIKHRHLDGSIQILDSRRTYNWNPWTKLMELCGSVASTAQDEDNGTT